MYIEDEYIRNQFEQNFIQKNCGQIVIYGTGLHTKDLLEAFPDHRIVGLMDAKRTGEVLWGKKVLSYEEVAALSDVSIVIVARNAVINIIVRRIEAFCRQNEIMLYDLSGRDLLAGGIDETSKECFCLKKEELLAKAEKADVITFDIFDTLITRKIMRPRDIFAVMDEQLSGESFTFSVERMNAEGEFAPEDNVTIHEIYARMQQNLGLSDQERERLLALEVATEKQFLTKREEMCELLTYFAKQGKRIFLITDMYLTKEIICGLLDELGVTGYEDVFVSCEMRISKQEGLFAQVVKKEKLEDANILHIGDNFFSDIIAAQKTEIDTYQIYGPVEMLENSIYSGVAGACHSLEENIVVATLAVHLYNSPFVNCKPNGKVTVISVPKLVRLFVAPVLVKYIVWLSQQLAGKGYKRVLFPARDGFIMQKIYDVIAAKDPGMELPKSAYFYTSRRTALVAAAKSLQDIEAILGISYESGDTVKLMKDRFGMDIADETSLEKVMALYGDTLLAICAAERKAYLEYVTSLGISERDRVALVDFVAIGTVQRALMKFMPQKLMGFYFMKRRDTEGLVPIPCESMYQAAGDFEMQANIYTYYYFLETIVTSYEPSFKKIGPNGEKIFFDEGRDQETLDLLKGIHEEILAYADEILSLLPNIREADADVAIYDKILGFFSADYSDLQDNQLGRFVNIDEFMGKRVAEVNR